MQKQKNDLLGMAFGTASHRLRKAIMFDMAKKLQMSNCYRCGLSIDSVEEFSIEHKEAWQSQATPKEAFFRLDNIAFSHLSCNASSASKPGKAYDSDQIRLRAKVSRYYYRNKAKIAERKKRKRNGHIAQ